MGPRTILYTGKGGVGKTSVAAATARRLAAGGARTLVLSTDPAHSLADSLGARLGPEPVSAGEGLWAQQVDAQAEIERHWAGVQEWLSALLIDHGVSRISAEELTVPPGLDEVFALTALQSACESGRWDAIVVDCAPTGETLRLLSFPELARWWIEKVFPLEQRIAASGPLARALLDLELPGHAVFADVQALSERLLALHALLRDRERCTLRLVMTPDRMVVGEAMRTFTYLNLYGFLTDAVIVNRVFPGDAGAYFSAWRERQEEQLALVRSAFEPVPVLCAPFFAREVIGPEMLDALAAALFDSGAHDPGAVLHTALTQELELDAEGARLRLALPFAAKPEVSLKQVGRELIVRVDGRKRTVALPAVLAGYRPHTARLEGGNLEVTFHAAATPEPS
jgi:arsenite-transporting ATPase